MSDPYKRDYALQFRKRGFNEELAPEDCAEIIRQSSFFSSAIAHLLTMLDPSELGRHEGTNLQSTLETIGELIINFNSEICSNTEALEKALEESDDALESATTFLEVK